MTTILTTQDDERFIQLSDRLNLEYLENIGDIANNYLEYNAIIEPHTVFLELDEDVPIACGSFREIDDDSVEIRRLFVVKEHRRKNIALKIMKKLEKEAVSKGYSSAYLVTGIENKASNSLYKKLGYSYIENFGQFKGDDLCVCMKKNLK